MFELRLITRKTFPKFLTLDQFLSDSQPKQTLRQTSSKLSDDNTINNGTTGKTKLSDEKMNYENQGIRLKVTAEDPLKQEKYRRIVLPFLF